MNAQIESARSHPAVVASLVTAALAVAVCALVAIAYMLGWVPAKPAIPAAPTSVAIPGQQVAGSAPDLALLPGETVVAGPEAPSAMAPAKAPPPQPVAPSYAKPVDAKSTPLPRKAPPPIYAQPPPPPSSTTYAQVLPSRAAPGKPNYTRSEMEAPPTSYERSLRAVCVNCGVIASLRPADDGWDVRVRFDDGSAETLRYPDPPRLRVGERVHLEDGRLIPD